MKLVQITKRYGAIDITLGTQTEAGDTRSHIEIVNELEQQFGQLERDYLRTASPATASSALTETIPFEKITVQMWKGKPNIRFHGGRWTQYGVAAYPEVTKSLPEDYHQLGEHDVKGMMTIELKEDGKPKKVLSFTHDTIPF